MHDPRTYWLVVSNIVLGIAVLLVVLTVITSVLCELVAKWRRRREIRNLDREMGHLFRYTVSKGARRH